jgi:hypothetical protein
MCRQAAAIFDGRVTLMASRTPSRIGRYRDAVIASVATGVV